MDAGKPGIAGMKNPGIAPGFLFHGDTIADQNVCEKRTPNMRGWVGTT